MRRILASFALLLGASCGLVSDDVGRFNLRFPSKQFTVDTADWRLFGGSTAPSVACSLGCQQSMSTLCGASSCSVDCDDATQTCQMHVGIALRNDFDLAAEAPEYQRIADQPFISVTVDEVYFLIDENTLSTATPTLYVYMGPMSISQPSDPDARLVGIIDPLAPGRTGRVDVRFEGEGRQVMKGYMDDFHMPFRVLVSGEITVHGGDTLPTGRLVGSVQADAHAGL